MKLERARMLIAVARAHAQRWQVAEATAVLLEAEQIAPEQLQKRRVARRLVTDLLTVQEPPAAELRELADRVGA